MTTASNEASDRTEVGAWKCVDRDGPLLTLQELKFPRQNAQIHAWTNTFILTVKTGTKMPQANAQIYPWTNTFTVKMNHSFLIPTTQHGMRK